LKIKILVCVWQRPEITRICFEGIKRLQKKFDIDPVIIYSEKSMSSLIAKYKFEKYFHENLPLGRKFNFGIEMALKSEWDYLMTLGSDNLITDSLIELYKKYEGKDAFGIDTAYLYNSETGEAGVFKNGYAIGAGRMLARRVVETQTEVYRVMYLQSVAGKETIGKGRVRDLSKEQAEMYIKLGAVKLIAKVRDNRKIYDDEANRTLDFKSDFNITCKGYHVGMIKTDEVYCLDIKSKVNIWPFDFYEKTTKDVLKYFPENEQIRGLI